MTMHTQPVFNPRQGDNVPSLGIPIANATLMYELFQRDPAQFTENTVGNFTALNASPRAVKEQVDAGYVEFNTRWRALTVTVMPSATAVEKPFISALTLYVPILTFKNW